MRPGKNLSASWECSFAISIIASKLSRETISKNTTEYIYLLHSTVLKALKHKPLTPWQPAKGDVSEKHNQCTVCSTVITRPKVHLKWAMKFSWEGNWCTAHKHPWLWLLEVNIWTPSSNSKSFLRFTGEYPGTMLEIVCAEMWPDCPLLASIYLYKSPTKTVCQR